MDINKLVNLDDESNYYSRYEFLKDVKYHPEHYPGYKWYFTFTVGIMTECCICGPPSESGDTTSKQFHCNNGYTRKLIETKPIRPTCQSDQGVKRLFLKDECYIVVTRLR